MYVRWTEFSFTLVPRGKTLPRYVLLAALSTFRAGPLPEDELLG